MMRRLVRAAALAVLFAGAAWFSARDYARLLRDTLTMARLPYEQRRERVLGSDYATMRRLANEIPRDATVAIVLRQPRDIDRAIFLNYYLYPRTTRISIGSAKEHAGVVISVDGGDMRVVP